jgi:hypothetical protein
MTFIFLQPGLGSQGTQLFAIFIKTKMDVQCVLTFGSIPNRLSFFPNKGKFKKIFLNLFLLRYCIFSKYLLFL